MGIAQSVRSTFKNMWGHGDDEYERDEADALDTPDAYRAEAESEPRPQGKYATSASHKPTYSGGGGSGSVRRFRTPDSFALRAREKNIYTLKPKNQEEACIAADCLKTGSAVVLNLDEVDRVTAVRIIDFMSGVCYGLDNQGHAMKLGETIFLFTPGDFEISSDETDYGENPDLIFKDETPLPRQPGAPQASHAPQAAPMPQTPMSAPFAERPAVAERPVLERPTMERPTMERPTMERPTMERPAGERRVWER